MWTWLIVDDKLDGKTITGASQAEMTVLSELDFKSTTKGRAYPPIGKWVNS